MQLFRCVSHSCLGATPTIVPGSVTYGASEPQSLTGLAYYESDLTAAQGSETEVLQAGVTQADQQNWLTNKRQVQKRYRDRQKVRRCGGFTSTGQLCNVFRWHQCSLRLTGAPTQHRDRTRGH